MDDFADTQPTGLHELAIGSRKRARAASDRKWVPTAATGFTALLIVLAAVTLYEYPDSMNRAKTALTSPDCFWCGEKLAPRVKAADELPAINTSQPTQEEQLSLAQEARGRGDYGTAVEKYRGLANAGNALAQNNLGVMYSTGEGVEQNYQEAVRWYRMAASQGLADSQFNLATKYDQGLGVDQNLPEAFKWYLLAAGQGNAYAQGNVGAMYAEGQGVAQDYAEALKWYRLAVTQGNATAQHGLGGMYFSGLGVARDSIRAYMWFSLAAASGGPNSARVRDKVAKLLTPQQVGQAQQMAHDCQQRKFQGC